ncbi:helix-turn-helix domain-containing protein [Sporolactobacillus terrae]|uniref:helix-turn-helix domain-containing protein n=1 Tax=Sporolactobacillus terrae TaxID=269673 RepID=UPI0009DFB8AD|nr:helix-turn-helix domain-containing protein [Sporolactobacillus terrae]
MEGLIFLSSFGEYLRQTRESKGLTLNQTAMYSGISAAQLSRIENGKRGIPKPPTIKALAEALKVNYEDLMEKAGYIDSPDKLDDNNENDGEMYFFEKDKWSPEEIDEARAFIEARRQMKKKKNK